MPDTYSQILIHFVFAVKDRECTLKKTIRDEVFKYIAGIIKGKNESCVIVNGTENHVHNLAGLSPSTAPAELIKLVKGGSSKFINEKKLLPGKFAWQRGYSAFSCSRTQLNKVFNYIAHQEEHHRKKTFKEELIDILDKSGIEYNPDYLHVDV